MKLEEQVVSLELAKKLRSLNVKQESYFWYTLPEGEYVQTFMDLNPAYEGEDSAPTKVQLTEQPDFYGQYGKPVTKVSAFTVGELGEVTNRVVVNDAIQGYLEEYIGYLWFKRQIPSADDLAEYVVWLIENKYLEVK